MMKMMVRGLVVVFATSLLVACGGDDSTDSTFSCNGGGTTMNCLSNTQYCELATTDGTTITRAACMALPSGCVDSPCGNCLSSGTNGIISCSSIRFGTNRSTTVTVRR